MIPIALLVAIIAFFLIHLSPGDPATFFVSPDAPPEELERVRERLGVDQPIFVQFGRWLGGVVQGDLGVSFFQRRPVIQAYLAALPVTLMLAVGGMAIALTLALPIGIISALKKDSLVDKIGTVFVFAGISMPNFWFGMLLILLFAVFLGWLPAQGFIRGAGLGGYVRSLILPALALGYPNSALIARMTRSSMLEVMRQDYVQTARAKGLRAFVVTSRHAFMNAINPILTVVGLVFARMMAGSVVIETVFNLPGVGRLVVNSVMRRDYPVIQGALLLTALLIVGFNLIIDLLYAIFDPRIRYD